MDGGPATAAKVSGPAGGRLFLKHLCGGLRSKLFDDIAALAGSDFSSFNAPTSLDGIGVTLNGKPAFIYYVSPNQININTPEDTGTSNTVMVNRARLSQTLQTVLQFLIGG